MGCVEKRSTYRLTSTLTQNATTPTSKAQGAMRGSSAGWAAHILDDDAGCVWPAL
jgi:hypothetical protein